MPRSIAFVIALLATVQCGVVSAQDVGRSPAENFPDTLERPARPSATAPPPMPRVRNAYDEWRDTGPREQERERREQDVRDERRREQDLLDDHRRTERAQLERAAEQRRAREATPR